MNIKLPRFLKFGLVAGSILFASKSITAQVFPVQVSPNMVPPYSMKLSDYNTASYEKIAVNLLLTDVGELNRQVGIRMYIENGRNIAIQSAPVVSGAMPIYLDGGVPVQLTNLDLQPYFQLGNLQGISPQQYNQPLPDGLYQFCFEVYDWASGLPISAKSCATAYLVLNDPPMLNFPSRGEVVVQKDPQNIIFQWSPRHINATNVQYEFTLTELWDQQMDPQSAFLASRPLYQTTTSANTLLYGPAETSLLPDKMYGWRVRAVVTDGISETSIFKNEGYSEIFYFTYTGDCDEPIFVMAEAESPTAENIYWQDGGHMAYHVQYRKKAEEEENEYHEWFEVNAYTTNATLYNLERGTTYEFRVGGQCNPEGGYSYSQINEFTTPNDIESAGYNCGITSEIEITNTKPLPQLLRNEVFTAGDFPVTVKEIKGGDGTFTGWGYIVVPYLQDTRIKVNFQGIKINSDYKLIQGIVFTTYDQEIDNLSDFNTTITAVQETITAIEDIVTGGDLQNDPESDGSGIIFPPDQEMHTAKEWDTENFPPNLSNEVLLAVNENIQEPEHISPMSNPDMLPEDQTYDLQINQELEPKELYVYHGNYRKAKSGDTLYLVNNEPGMHELLNGKIKTEKKVVYEVEIDAGIMENEQQLNTINWFYGGENDRNEWTKARDAGKLKVIRNLKETDSLITTIVKAGTASHEKSIHVQWIEYDRKTVKVVPRSLQNIAEHICGNAQKLGQITDKLRIKGWKLEPKIESFGLQYNEEDTSSRFYKTVRKGGINAKVELKKEEISLPYPFSIQLKIPITGKTVANLGAYIEPKLELGLSGQLVYEKTANEKAFKRTFNDIMLVGSGGLEFGAKIESKTEVLNIDFKAYGKTALTARGKLVFPDNGDEYEFAPQVFLDPLVAGFKGKLKAGSYTIFENAVEWQLFDRWYWYDGLESKNL